MYDVANIISITVKGVCMIGEMFLFDKFNRSSLETSLTEKQIKSFTLRMIEMLLKYNNNSAITLEYLVENLKFIETSPRFSKNDNPSRPFIFIDIQFMLESTLIEARVSAEFNSACCRIPLTYYKYEIKIEKTEKSPLLSVLNLYKPDVGVHYFYFGTFRDDSVYTVTTKNAFKFQHYFIKTRHRFYIEYTVKKDKVLSSKIIDDENDDYLTYDNKPLSAHDETLFIHFANAAYTKHSEFINSFINDSINFKDMKCFAELKKIFLNLYKGEHRDGLIKELLVVQMAHI